MMFTGSQPMRVQIRLAYSSPHLRVMRGEEAEWSFSQESDWGWLGRSWKERGLEDCWGPGGAAGRKGRDCRGRGREGR